MLGVQGAKSVEVRPVGISKGLAMSRIINAIAARGAQESVQYDFVLVAGHFLVRDENIFTFFEGQSLKARSAHIPYYAMLPVLDRLTQLGYSSGGQTQQCEWWTVNVMHCGMVRCVTQSLLQVPCLQGRCSCSTLLIQGPLIAAPEALCRRPCCRDSLPE